MSTIRTRLNRLEANAPLPANGENLTADFIRRCLVSDGLDPDNLPPLTEEGQAWAEQVFEAAAQVDADGRHAGAH